jgi:RNase P protein component
MSGWKNTSAGAITGESKRSEFFKRFISARSCKRYDNVRVGIKVASKKVEASHVRFLHP